MRGSFRSEVSGWRLIAGYLGVVLMLIGGIILLPLLVLAAYPGEAVWASCFLVPGVGSVFAGYLFHLLIRGREKLRLC